MYSSLRPYLTGFILKMNININENNLLWDTYNFETLNIPVNSLFFKKNKYHKHAWSIKTQ